MMSLWKILFFIASQLLRNGHSFLLPNRNRFFGISFNKNVECIVRVNSGSDESEIVKEKEAAASDASFEDAQVIGRNLATILTKSCTSGEPMPEEARTLLRTLISTTSGARGWFVSLLTSPDFEQVFIPPIDESFLTALCDNPEPNIKLMTMNVAMPTATELTHIANGNPHLADGSRMTSRRAGVLIMELINRLPGLRESLEALLTAVDGRKEEDADEEWVKFTKKWGYGLEQKEAIKKEIEMLLNR